MLEKSLLNKIRQAGVIGEGVEMTKRDKIVRQEMGFRLADKAEYALLASCIQPFRVPQDMKAFKALLDYLQVDYSLLTREYCCGGTTLYLEALRAKSKEAENEVDKLAQEFQENNIKQIRALGASKVVAFCAGCDILYKRFQYPQSPGRLAGTPGRTTPLEIIWYPTLLARFFKGGKLKLEADYYAGCHMLYGKYCPSTPVDLESPLAALNKVEGLKLNHLDNHLCCVIPEQVNSLFGKLKTQTVISVCPACTIRVQKEINKSGGNQRVLSLSQILLASVTTHNI